MDCNRFAFERSSSKMRNDLYRQLLMPSREVYYDLSVSYELSRLVNNIQIMNMLSW